MKVNILKVKDDTLVDAQILDSKTIAVALPSVVDGWRFNFNKHAKKACFETYILICEETPEIIEGCLIFEMKEKIEPYVAFVEIAPHNRGDNRRYERVAGCLIAFACRLSFTKGDEVYRGWLAFDVFEEDKENE